MQNKKGRIRGVKNWQAALTILVALSGALILAEDFKTVNGKEYKNSTISRVEPDGIVPMRLNQVASGIVHANHS
jgi:hypothetical protein